ncbi:HAMP domain-containing sensor histidine kinase [Bacillus tianshenii]|nr:HAMP domain-containing sensor histidine kinase [Bacillus tianshenii]
MFTKLTHKQSMLRYWTNRYLLTLCIGLVIIGFVSVLWIRHTTLENRLNLTEILAEEIADRVINQNGSIHFGPIMDRVLEERQKLLNLNSELNIYITDNHGNLFFKKPKQFLPSTQPFIDTVLQNEERLQKLKARNDMVYVQKVPIENENGRLGWVITAQTKSSLTAVNQEYRLLAILLISLGLLGWGVIYFLLRKLTKPIEKVSSAAKDIQVGNYDIQLTESMPEKELDELIHSFKDMSQRLQQLEDLRAELLASVTHELKTPVTSISGLIQALKDEVVTGDEAKEFLDISLKEATRLQHMVHDLLEFNSFAAGSISIQTETHSVSQLVNEILYQWNMTNEDNKIETDVTLPSEPIYAEVDASRLQQVLINLFKNAQQAMENEGYIHTKIHKKSEQYFYIDIQDNGPGIPEAEQSLIFERFYRGEAKKHKVRGLGIGLPYSKLLAKAMGGDLFLSETSSAGTTFTIKLPYTKKP